MNYKFYRGALNKIFDGLGGKNKGVPTSSKMLNKWITNIQKERIYIISGSSGSGKTSFANELYVFSMFDEYIKHGKIKPEIIYFSFEMTKENLIGKLICRWLYTNHNIIISPNQLFSYGDNRCPKKVLDIIKQEECQNYISKFEEVTKVFDISMGVNEIVSILESIGQKNGSFQEKDNGFKTYVENEEGKHVLVVIDHAALVKLTPGKSKKSTIDDLTPHLIRLRKMYKFSIVILQQLNRNISSTDRLKLDQMLPNDADLKETSDLYDACDVCLGIFNPFKYRIPRTFGYDICTDDASKKKFFLEDRFRIMNIMKNRHGDNNKIMPVGFIGENGIIIDLPASSKLDIFNFNDIIEKKLIA